jgi:hypothetical protein
MCKSPHQKFQSHAMNHAVRGKVLAEGAETVDK